MFSAQNVLSELSSAGLLTLCLTILLGFIILRYLFTGKKNLPPGPIGLPLIGYFPFLTNTPHKKLRDLSKKYGDVMSFKIFGTDVIHLNSADAIREAFVTHGDEFAGRQEVILNADSPMSNQGIVPTEGEVWKIHRRFALQTLRDFGFGKLTLESRVQGIAEDILKVLEKSKGEPFDVHDILANATTNVICSLLFDKNFHFEDEQFKKIQKSIQLLINSGSPNLMFLNGVSFLRYIPVNYLPGMPLIIKCIKDFENVIYGLIKEHQDTIDPNFLRDYVDVFLDEMTKHKNTGEKSTFTTDRLMAVAAGLFFAGTETSSTTLYWALRLLMLHPEIQRKLQSEIDEVVGRERLPSTTDRQNMPYAEATINEILRISSIVPLSLFRCNPEEVKFRNFTIPKRSIIAPNLWAAHMDPKYWSDPEKFDPTRFLDADGKVQKRESFFPFSLGKRVCLGESLAKMEIFIFLTSVLQRFTIEHSPEDTQKTLETTIGFVTSVKPYKICARHR